MLDRQMISVLNDHTEYRIRNGEDETDVITSSIEKAHCIIAYLSPDIDEDDLVAQLRRARAYDKSVIAVLKGSQGNMLPSMRSADLARLLNGRPHLYADSERLIVDLLPFVRQPRAITTPQLPQEHPRGSTFDVFICHSSRDFEIADRVFEYLTQHNKRVFLSERSLPAIGSAEYMKAIDQALNGARHLIVIGSTVENILSGWVEAEWRVFINEKRSGRKLGNILTIIPGALHPQHLPMSLRYYEVLQLENALSPRLLEYLRGDSSDARFEDKDT